MTNQNQERLTRTRYISECRIPGHSGKETESDARIKPRGQVYLRRRFPRSCGSAWAGGGCFQKRARCRCVPLESESASANTRGRAQGWCCQEPRYTARAYAGRCSSVSSYALTVAGRPLSFPDSNCRCSRQVYGLCADCRMVCIMFSDQSRLLRASGLGRKGFPTPPLS